MHTSSAQVGAQGVARVVVADQPTPRAVHEAKLVPIGQLRQNQPRPWLTWSVRARNSPPHDTVLPATQVPLEQQPPLQGLVALHAEVQAPLLHASPAGQSVSELQPQVPVTKQTWPAPLVAQLTQAAPAVQQVVVLEV
jgi:hypothetical protein